MSRRVAITGLGTVCGFGVGAAELFDALVDGRSCLRPISLFDPAGFDSKLAGEAVESDGSAFSAKGHVPKSYRKAVKVMARDIQLAVAAANAAVQDANLMTRGIDPDADTTYPSLRMGCQIGAGLIASDTAELTDAYVTATADDGSGISYAKWGGVEHGKGMNRLTPLWMLKFLPNMLACHVTILHGTTGPSNTITCAEASGMLSMGESMRVIQRGAADLCFSGGAESKVNVQGFFRMESAGRLAPTGTADEGVDIVRPFDDTATGTILGEGGGIVILEELEQARARGARVYAELAGFASSQSRPGYPDGADDVGMRSAVTRALRDADVTPDDIDAIAPLGQGLLSVDTAEAGALNAVFGERASSLPVISLVPNVGNAMAGIGGLQVAAAAMAIERGVIPNRLHAGEGTMGIGGGSAEGVQPRCVLVLTGSWGGQNAAIVLKNAS